MLNLWEKMEDVKNNSMVKVFLKKEDLWDPLLVMDKVDYKVKDLKIINPKNLKMINNKEINNKMINKLVIEDT